MPEPAEPEPPPQHHRHSDPRHPIPNMSLPNPTPSSTASRSYKQEGSSSSSSWRPRSTAGSFPPPLLNNQSDNKHKVEDSDDDLFRVPDVESHPLMDSTPTTATTNVATNTSNNPDVQQSDTSGKRPRGRNPVDREYRKLKRLLRNRVSAQQARERKKVYVSDQESRAQELQEMNSKLEEKISTLVNENTMLRKVLMNTRPKVDESSTEPTTTHDQLSKS